MGIGPAGVRGQTFCAVRKESSDLNDEPNSGLLGMAFGSIAETGRPTFFENLLAGKKLAQSIFSVHLTRTRETGSQVCFGCYDATKAVGPVRWNPVISRVSGRRLLWRRKVVGVGGSPFVLGRRIGRSRWTACR